MRCSEIQDLLVAYSAGELTPAQREFVHLHLEGCAGCRQALADLELTRRQLESLRAERYQPQLAPRIKRAAAHRRRRFPVAAVAAVGALLVAALAWWQGALPGMPAPAGPPAGTTAFLVQADRLLQVDTGRRTVSQALPTDWNAQLVTGGGTRLLLSEGQLTAIGPNGATRPIGQANGLLVGISPDGRTAYTVLQDGENRWRVGRIDLTTGEVTPSDTAFAGRVQAGIVSTDGALLYLLATVDGVSWVKEVESGSGAIARVHRIPGFENGGTLLLSSDGARLYIVGNGPVAAISPGTNGEIRAIQVSGATTHAVLVPGTHTVLAAHEQSGFLQITLDPINTKRIPGAFYTKLLWGEEGTWLYALSGGQLDVLDPTAPTKPLSRIPLGR